jgi:hypothetical protein
MSNDSLIAEILAKYGEDMREATWSVQGTRVILHKAVERIAAKAGIVFDRPQVLRAERDEAVLLVVGHMGDKTEWSIGEALLTDGSRPGNYRVTGRMASYVYAMAEKRAKDRVALKLIGLHGLVYSEDEADDFRRPDGGAEDAKSAATAYVSMAKTAVLNATTVAELDDWWRGEADRRRTYGIVKGTPAYDELAAACAAHKQSLLQTEDA